MRIFSLVKIAKAGETPQNTPKERKNARCENRSHSAHFDCVARYMAFTSSKILSISASGFAVAKLTVTMAMHATINAGSSS